MTICISLKVNDGVVLAADSATTLLAAGQQQNVYDHANKIVNLVKGVPIGVGTFGLGGIGPSSIATLLKDLRVEMTDGDTPLDRSSYTVQGVAQRLADFVYAGYDAHLAGIVPTSRPVLGFFVCGYSFGESLAEEYHVAMGPDGVEGPSLLRQKDETGVSFQGEPSPLQRLILGFDPKLRLWLHSELGYDDNQAETAINEWKSGLGAPYVQAPMPIQDAIDLARWMVELTSMHKRFMPGMRTVGGPVEVAAITKHEGFKWVQRKHYFSTDFNWEGQR